MKEGIYKMKKKILCILVALFVTIGFGSTAFALDSQFIEITPCVETACGYGNGICDAVARGVGAAYNTNTNALFFNGCIWQCSKCYTVYVTEYDPLGAIKIGKWCSKSYREPVSSYFTYVHVIAISTTTARTIPGVHFRYDG